MFVDILSLAFIVALTSFSEDSPMLYQQDKPCSPEELSAVAMAARLEAAQLTGDLRTKRISQLRRELRISPVRYVVITRERECAKTELKLSVLSTEYEAQMLRNTLLKKQLDLLADELIAEKKARAKEQASASADITRLSSQLEVSNALAGSRGVQLEETRQQLTIVQKHDVKGRGWKSGLKRLFGRKVKQ